jgi:hypothetical protein
MCGRKRNTSGDYQLYSNYIDYRGTDDYAVTARINRSSAEERKLVEELSPVDGELLITFIERTSLGIEKVCENGIKHHLFGTKKVWACHTSSRYCFICVMAQYVSTLGALWITLREVMPEEEVRRYHINVDNSAEIPRISIEYK